MTAVPSVRLPGTRYLTGVPDTEKTVDFWSMQAMTIKDFEANEEISDLRWVSVEEAHTMLTYAHDRGVVSAFAALPTVTGIAVLVRHAHAGSRKEWTGDDDHRPLDERGEQQAAALGPLLSLFKPARVCAAPLARCIDTVAPIGLPVRTDTVFAEATGATPKAVADRLRSLVADHTRVVVSSQGGVIPAALEAMRPPNASATRTFTTPKGTGWVLSFNGTDLVAADPLAL